MADRTSCRVRPLGARITPQNAHRCGQPGQQHGRRMPSLSSEHTLSTCWRLVSSFLTEMVQQIHSLRARGVMSSQAASAFASDASALRRSAGRSCTTPPEIRTVVIELSRRLEDQGSDTRVQLGFQDYRAQTRSNRFPGRVRQRLLLKSVPRPAWDGEAIRHVIGGLVVARHRCRGRPGKVVVEHLSQLTVVV